MATLSTAFSNTICLSSFTGILSAKNPGEVFFHHGYEPMATNSLPTQDGRVETTLGEKAVCFSMCWRASVLLNAKNSMLKDLVRSQGVDVNVFKWILLKCSLFSLLPGSQ